MKFDFDSFFETFWYSYSNELCHYKKGVKSKAKTAAKRRVRTQEEADRINANTEAWARYSLHEKAKTKYTDRWPAVSVWFNQERYDCEIPPYTEMASGEKVKLEVKTCIHCNEPVHGPNYSTCTGHIGVVKVEKEKFKPGKARVHLDTIKQALK